MRITALLLVAAVAILMMSGPVFAAIEGEGTEDNPFVISTVEDLMEFNQHYEDIYDTYPDFESQFGATGPFYQVSKSVAEFDLSEEEWIPVGTGMKPFTGSFYGNGIVITDLSIYLPDDDDLGFFGYTDEALISNINFKNVSVTGDECIGILIGNAENTIVSSCSVINGSVAANETVGGFVGYYYASVPLSYLYFSNNVYYGDVYSESEYAGGLIGNFETNTADEIYLNNSVFNGSVSAGGCAGGLIGYLNGEGNSNLLVTSSFVDGHILSEESSGGIIGYTCFNDGMVQIKSAVVNATIDSEVYSGGLVGDLEGSNTEFYLDSNYVRGAISSEIEYAGGFIGDLFMSGDSGYSNLYVNNSIFEGIVVIGIINENDEFESTGNYSGGMFGGITADNTSVLFDGNRLSHSVISGADYVGGIAGYFEGVNTYLEISNNSMSDSVVSGFNGLHQTDSGNSVGGFFGQVHLSENDGDEYASNLIFNRLSNVEVLADGGYAGGFIGYLNATIGNSSAYLEDNFFEGDVCARGNSSGGFVGTFNSTAGESRINNSVFKGTVTGERWVGGLTGYMNASDSGISNGGIFNSYALADVKGTDYVGGLAGYIHGDTEYSYFVGNITTEDYAGGLIGVNVGNVSNSYSVSNISHISDTSIGRFVGSGETGSTISDSYAAGNIANFTGSGDTLNAYCISDSEMKSNSTFLGWNMYDFVQDGPDLEYYHDWVIAEGCFYPQLFNQRSYNQEPIEITQPEDFARIGTGDVIDGKIWLLSVDYVLNSSEFDSQGRPVIDMANINEFKPIGSEETPFTGNFDGNGHVIKNINYMFESTDLRNIGLFDSVSHNTIKDLMLENIVIGVKDTLTDNVEYAGALAGTAH